MESKKTHIWLDLQDKATPGFKQVYNNLVDPLISTNIHAKIPENKIFLVTHIKLHICYRCIYFREVCFIISSWHLSVKKKKRHFTPFLPGIAHSQFIRFIVPSGFFVGTATNPWKFQKNSAIDQNRFYFTTWTKWQNQKGILWDTTYERMVLPPCFALLGKPAQCNTWHGFWTPRIKENIINAKFKANLSSLRETTRKWLYLSQLSWRSALKMHMGLAVYQQCS